VKRCSRLLDIDETVVLNELNRTKRQIAKKETPTQDVTEVLTHVIAPSQQVIELETEEQEKNIIRLLLIYGHRKLSFVENRTDDAGRQVEIVHEPHVARFIVDEITGDAIRAYAGLPEETPYLDPTHFLHSEDQRLRETVVELLSPRYQLSENWYAMHGISVPSEENELLRTVEQSVFHLKQKKVLRMLEESRQKIREAQSNGSDLSEILENHLRLERIKSEIAKALGIDILR
jgi:DNA primase